MKKNTKLAYAVLGIVFILFNVIAFAVPTDKTITFWIAYAFTVVAFALQIGIWNAAFKATETLKSKFLGVPIIYVGIVYLVLQLIAFAVFMIFPLIPSWIVVIACALVLGISAICLISADVARDEINRVEEKVNQKVFYIRELQADVEILAEQEQNPEIKTSLTRLAEKIRYSDPMSNVVLADLEARIREKVTALRTADHKLEIIAELDLLLAERNKKAKILK
mgnify:CR=1 FL=1